MKTFTLLLSLASAAPALAQDRPKAEPPKVVYRTLDKMLKDFSRAAQAQARAEQAQLLAKR